MSNKAHARGLYSFISMTPAMHRRLVVAASWLLLVPATIVALLGFVFSVLFALRGTPASLLVAANGLIAMLALLATFAAGNAFAARGEEGLLALRPRVFLAMRAGLVLVGVGALALLVERIAAPVDTGALGFNVLGLPAVVPCAHLLWLRSGAAGQELVPGRTWPALVALAAAMFLLQFVATGPLPFDRARWDASAHDGRDPWNRRQRMADWLILDGSLVGRGDADVVARLGAPGYRASGVIGYPVGEGRGIGGFGDEMLWLPLDDRGRVESAEIFNTD